ncbi:uncharacterized protein [Procambarus clarkii]|uniref:uncharacterized protein isoform X1 n=1 Tax=Procambarus clarkii TaxID=6728 RepID=UPI0037427E75
MSTKRECSPPLPGPEGRGGGSVEPCKLDEGFYIIDETKEMAQAVIEPFIAEVDAHEKGNLDWVRDIVEGNPTDERIINCTKDEKDPSNPVDKKYPFYLVENKVQKGGVEEYIHYLAIPKDYMKIRSLRHLRKTEEDHIEEGRNEEDHIKEGRNEEDHIKEGRNEEDHIKEGRNEEDHIKEGRNEEDHIKEGRNEEDQKKEGRNKEDHIELLETILEDSKKKFKEFGIPGEKLHIYIKYPPADWFLHVHFHAIYLTPEETTIAREKIDKKYKKGGKPSSTVQDAGTAGASSCAAGTAGASSCAAGTAGASSCAAGTAGASSCAAGTAGASSCAAGTAGASSCAAGTAGASSSAAGTAGASSSAAGTAGASSSAAGTAGASSSAAGTAGASSSAAGTAGASSSAAGTAGASSSAAGTKCQLQVFRDIMIGKAHPLVTVISNLKMNGRYYEEVTLAVSLKERCLNLGCFYQYYELTKKPEEDKEREEEREVWRRKHMDCVVLYEKTRGKISEEHAKTKMTKGKKYFPFKKVKEILELNFKYNISENNIKEKPYFLGETKVRIKLSDGRSKFYLMKAAREFESYYGVSEFISGNTKKVFKELFQLKKDNKEKHQPNKANKAEIKQLYTCNGIIKVLMKGEQHMHDVTTQDQLETFILKYKLTSPNTLQ